MVSQSAPQSEQSGKKPRELAFAHPGSTAPPPAPVVPAPPPVEALPATPPPSTELAPSEPPVPPEVLPLSLEQLGVGIAHAKRQSLTANPNEEKFGWVMGSRYATCRSYPKAVMAIDEDVDTWIRPCP